MGGERAGGSTNDHGHEDSNAGFFFLQWRSHFIKKVPSKISTRNDLVAWPLYSSITYSGCWADRCFWVLSIKQNQGKNNKEKKLQDRISGQTKWFGEKDCKSWQRERDIETPSMEHNAQLGLSAKISSSGTHGPHRSLPWWRGHTVAFDIITMMIYRDIGQRVSDLPNNSSSQQDHSFWGIQVQSQAGKFHLYPPFNPHCVARDALSWVELGRLEWNKVNVNFKKGKIVNMFFDKKR